MHRLLIAMTLCAAATLASATDTGSAQPPPEIQNSSNPEKPDWFKESFLDIREDVAEATASDQRVILYFYQDGCPYCTKLLRDNLSDRTIGTLARERFDIIAINIWGDREVTGFSGESTTEKEFAADLKVQFTPTMLLLDEAGAVVMRINGYYPPHRFGAALTYVSERRERTGERFPDFYAALNPREAKGKLPEEGGFLSKPARTKVDPENRTVI